VSKYLILCFFFFFFVLKSDAQKNFEIGFGVLGSGTAVDPLPRAYRSDFSGPITYLGYYLEGAALLFQNEKWKPRMVIRMQSEGSNASIDWPKVRLLNAGFGLITGYKLTPVVSILAGGVVNYRLSSEIESINFNNPRRELGTPLSTRLNVGIRGNFGRWSSEMLIERSFTSQTGVVVLSREGSPSFQPTYSYLNVSLGLKYRLTKEEKS